MSESDHNDSSFCDVVRDGPLAGGLVYALSDDDGDRIQAIVSGQTWITPPIWLQRSQLRRVSRSRLQPRWVRLLSVIMMVLLVLAVATESSIALAVPVVCVVVGQAYCFWLGVVRRRLSSCPICCRRLNPDYHWHCENCGWDRPMPPFLGERFTEQEPCDAERLTDGHGRVAGSGGGEASSACDLIDSTPQVVQPTPIAAQRIERESVSPKSKARWYIIVLDLQFLVALAGMPIGILVHPLWKDPWFNGLMAILLWSIFGWMAVVQFRTLAIHLGLRPRYASDRIFQLKPDRLFLCFCGCLFAVGGIITFCLALATGGPAATCILLSGVGAILGLTGICLLLCARDKTYG